MRCRTGRSGPEAAPNARKCTRISKFWETVATSNLIRAGTSYLQLPGVNKWSRAQAVRRSSCGNVGVKGRWEPRTCARRMLRGRRRSAKRARPSIKKSARRNSTTHYWREPSLAIDTYPGLLQAFGKFVSGRRRRSVKEAGVPDRCCDGRPSSLLRCVDVTGPEICP
jgi:hypothetical protein